MKEDELFAELRSALEDERAELSAWERVARGEGEPPPPRPGGDPAEHARMAEACAPLGAEAEERIVARIERERRGANVANVGDLAAARARRRRILGYIAGPLAAAAAVFLMLRAGGPGAVPGDALPDYAISVSGGAAAVRGDVGEHGTLTLGGSPDEIFEVVARPVTAVGHAVSARAFAVQNGQPTPIAADVQAASGGSIRVRGRADQLRGASALRVVVGEGSSARVLEVPIARTPDAR